MNGHAKRWAILSLEQCKEELEAQYEAIKGLIQAIEARHNQ